MNELAKPELPTWMMLMRGAAQKAVTEDDVVAIVKQQVERAKKGDKDAIKFVFGQVLGGDQKMTFVQNNFAEPPDQPTPAIPGTKSKLSKMAARAAAGLPLCNSRDGGEKNLS